MQFNQWYNQKVLSLTKKNNKIRSITLPGLCSLLEQSENGYGSVTAGILVLSDGAIFSSKCSMAIEEMSLSSCKNSWALGGCWGYFNVFRILSNSSRTCWKIFSKHVFKIIRLCPSDFVYISINLFFFEPLSKKLIFKHIFKEKITKFYQLKFLFLYEQKYAILPCQEWNNKDPCQCISYKSFQVEITVFQWQTKCQHVELKDDSAFLILALVADFSPASVSEHEVCLSLRIQSSRVAHNICWKSGKPGILKIDSLLGKTNLAI